MTDKKVARIVKEIEINGKKLIALFNTGLINTYIRKEAAPSNRTILKRPIRVGLGGKIREIKERCIIEGEIEGLGFSIDSYITEDLGTINGKQLDLIIGARTLEEWEIRLNPKTGELDLTGLKRGEFTEY
jgi:hypothetical protein